VSVASRLRQIPDVAEVLDRPADLFTYESDAMTLLRGRAQAVAFPLTTEAVAELVRTCNEAQVPFVARGAGTCLSGGATPVDGSVVIECSRMNRVLEVDPVNRTATVQPGLVNLHLSDSVAPLDLYYAPDPSSQSACTIGGNVAENSGGPHTLKHGTTSPHVLAIEVVLPDGSIVTLGRRDGHPSGYDLRGVFVGSEGTLGIATSLTVRLLRVPERVTALLASYRDLVSACRTVSSVIAAGYPRDARAVLLIELDGTDAAVASELERVEQLCAAEDAVEIRRAANEEERLAFWRGRKGAFGAMGRLAPDLYVHDAVVPRTRLPEVVERINRAAEARGIRLSNILHAGDGNLHPNISFDRRNEEEMERVRQLGTEILHICVAAGGMLSGEHGIGIEKRDYMGLVFSDEDLEPMRWVHDAFDPDDCCNPGKAIPAPRSCVESNPRYREYDRVEF
jgi:FAD/FMN-containing dehydrogenase